MNVPVWLLISGQILAAIITAGGVVGAAWIASQSIESYRKQKDVDREEAIAKRQREAYEHYFALFWALQPVLPASPEHVALTTQYQSARDNLSFYASDESLRKVSEFHKYIVQHSNNKDKDLDHIKNMYTSMILAMRRDCYGSTELTHDEVKCWLTMEL